MKKNSFQPIERAVNTYVMGTYSRKPLAFAEGKGSWLKTVDGKKVLDFFPGWGVSNLGHCHPRVVKAIRNQANHLIHLANVFYNPLQGRYAEALIQKSFPGRVFFSNSGTEAVECALKAAKAWGKPEGKFEIVSFHHSFHGRTVGSVTVTGNAHYRDPFGLLMPGVRYADYNDLESVSRQVSDKTCAVILELVQGEGGIHPATHPFVQGLKKMSREKNFLLIFDEVQTGFGRTGKMFAFQNHGVTPDLMCLAKSIANGMPMGATVFAEHLETVLVPGMHASTFGGNYLACAAALAVMEAFDKEKILQKMKPVQEKMETALGRLKKTYAAVSAFRHLGLMFGIELKGDYAKRIADRALEKGLVINCTAGNVLRIMPALNLSLKDCETGLKILEQAFEEVCNEAHEEKK